MGDVKGDVFGSQSKAGILGFGGLPASCEAVINLLFDSKDVHREIQGELKFGEKLTAVQGIIEVIAGGRVAVCGARN